MDTRYVPKEVNLKKAAQEWGMEVVEVSTIEEALPYFLGEKEE